MKLRYIDHRCVQINLRSTRGEFITLPNEKINNIIECTDDEGRVLLKRKNGNAPCFEPVETPKPRRAREQENE